MSIPVEKRDLVDGWVLTCRGEDGGDLTLTDLVVRREDLVCQGMKATVHVCSNVKKTILTPVLPQFLAAIQCFSQS